MNNNDDTDQPRWVPVLAIGGETTPKQRARNYALYQRLKDGDGTSDYKAAGLSGFVFEVPSSSVTFGGNTVDGKPGALTFRLDKESDCFRRLLHVITDHFDTKCDADDEVERLRSGLDAVYARLAEISAKRAGTLGGDIEHVLNDINALLAGGK